ncbi:DNA polymerase III subunit chi [Polaromonas sp.]|uniref:DNA polymerase III subunit chi n=1 Tax=Polaromonas sp. TaxID=1869339 RepID=UPI00286BA501|nr:DNA polymerase III subunit chi [Polaromonas sp.]
MTEIAFHTNVADPLIYSCRLLRKAYMSGARVVVTAPAETLARLDRELWSFSATDFVPHCHAGAEAQVLSRSPVVLAESLEQLPHLGVLVNLGQEVPAGFERFERFFEVVPQQEEGRLAGRRRWKHYQARGYTLKLHDAAAPPTGGG